MKLVRKKLRGIVRRPNSDQSDGDRPFWIGDSLVEPGLNQITRNGRTRHVERQVMRVLLFLAAHPGQPLSRDTIIDSIWEESVPNDEGLTQAISKLRKALGDRPGEGKVIQTIRKVGYRLVAPVERNRVAFLNKPFSFTVLRRSNPSRRSIRIRIDGNWLAAAAYLTMTLFFVLQIV